MRPLNYDESSIRLTEDDRVYAVKIHIQTEDAVTHDTEIGKDIQHSFVEENKMKIELRVGYHNLGRWIIAGEVSAS